MACHFRLEIARKDNKIIKLITELKYLPLIKASDGNVITPRVISITFECNSSGLVLGIVGSLDGDKVGVDGELVGAKDGAADGVFVGHKFKNSLAPKHFTE